VKKRKKLYEGRSKVIYGTDDPDQLVLAFKDEVSPSETAPTGQAPDGARWALAGQAKKGVIKGKGKINSQISAYIFKYLESYHVPSHFIRPGEDEDEIVVRRLEMIPVEVVLRNVAAGSFARRLGIEEGKELERPVLEFNLKTAQKGERLVNEDHLVAAGLARAEELQTIERLMPKINALLKSFFERRGFRLVDFQLEFGRYRGKILLGDEISSDTCRLWDLQTGEKFDRERLRSDLERLEAAYQKIYRRIFRREEQRALAA